ncbi:MAG TPA: SbmA/BacA-like family transporter [Candidatus Binatia bacterium]|jgi:putative ATP-binding cassette transporter|nr:SbmA/BacA-like family transporter [Candidatus Binatia bacterium]
MSTAATGSDESRLTRQTWRHFVDAIRNLLTGEVRGRAIFLCVSLLLIFLAINGLNVINSYVGRDFMTAIESKDMRGFTREALYYVLVFGASTVAAVLASYTQDLLGLLWRNWLTRRVVNVYLADRSYVRLQAPGGLPNPDQRISEDIRTFVTMTLSVSLMLLNGTITVVAFSGVLWSISRKLFLVGVLYAAVGSVMTILLGRRLVQLNYTQADREADFRSQLVHVRENAESIALQHREPRLLQRLIDQVGALIDNQLRIIKVSRNVGFFTTGYNYMIQIIPALIVAPMFMRGEVPFGAVTQAAMAFSTLLGAFSLVITQFQTISSYAAVMARLNVLIDALAGDGAGAGITVVEDGERVAWEHLTLRAPRDGRVLVRDLSVDTPRRIRLLVRGVDNAARDALVEATADIFHTGDGRIIRPPLGHLAFLPERPYLPPGTLREVLIGELDGATVGDDELVRVIGELNAEAVLERVGGLDREEDWSDVLSLREQELLAIARITLSRPTFVILHNPSRTLDKEHIALALKALCACDITCITFAALDDEDDHLAEHDALLELAADGSWSWKPIRDGVVVEAEVSRAGAP